MLNKKNLVLLSICSGIAIITAGCGGQAYQTTLPSGTNYSTSSNSSTSTGTGVDNSWYNGSSSGSGSGSTSSNLPPAIQTSFKLVGAATAPPTNSNFRCTQYSSQVYVGKYTVSNIKTDNLLQVTVTANSPMGEFCGTTSTSGTQTLGIGNTGTMAYSCVQLNVTPIFNYNGNVITGNPQTVTVSYGSPKSGPCANASSSATVDFSSFAQQQGVVGGTGYYTIQVDSPQIDNCRQFYGCATVSGTVLSNMTAGIYPGYCQHYGMTGIPSGAGNQYSGCNMGMAYDNFIISASLGIQINSP